MSDHPPTIILLGGAGDLAMRMLLPSLYYLDADGHLAEGTKIIGVAREKIDGAAYRDRIVEDFKLRAKTDPEKLATFLARVDFVSADLTAPEGGQKLNDKLAKSGLRVIFFSLSPTLYPAVCQNLKSMGVIDKSARLILEKPIGKDLETSIKVNEAVAAVADENRIFRIDHYLGKETVQNILALRFANTLFEPLWSHQVIDHVQITVAETEGVGARWPYYDEYGAIRDMLQNHMLQLLCFIAMEPPAALDPDAIRSEKVKVLKSLRLPTRASVTEGSVRGQYTAGLVEGKPVTGYLEEVGKPTNTETFVALKVEIDNWRWAGVPFFLRTGKRMPGRSTRIVIQFKALPHNIYSGAAKEDVVANRMVIDLQPQEDIVITLMNKKPGLGDMRLQPLPLSLSLAKALDTDGGRRRIAYEPLLLAVLRGDRTLFVRRDEVEQAWKFVDAVEDAWDEAGITPKPYAAGSWGPPGAFGMIERFGRTWDE